MNQREPDCGEFREWIHQVLDGDLMDEERRVSLDRHLAECESCRTAESELRQIQSTLRSAPSLSLPDEWLDEVFARTSRAPQESPARRGWGFDWRAAAAAAVLALALWNFWPSGQPSGYTQAELERAADEARLALKLTAQALARTERVGIEGVLGGEVSPALKRIPVRFPGVVPKGKRES